MIDLLGEVHLGQGVADGLGAHLGDERVRAVGFAGLAVFVLAEQLVRLERGRARVHHHVVFVIDDPLQVAGGHVEDQADAGGHAFEEPDVADRDGQLDMAHALAANAGEGDFDAATVANDAAVLDPLVLAAGAFPVLDGAEDALAEQAALFGLESAVVDGFGVFDFPFGPGTDGIRRRDGDRDVFHLVDLVQAEQFSRAFFAYCFLNG